MLTAGENSTQILAQQKLYWDVSNSYLGINLLSPQTTLDVGGNISLNGNILQLKDATNVDYSLQFTSTGVYEETYLKSQERLTMGVTDRFSMSTYITIDSSSIYFRNENESYIFANQFRENINSSPTKYLTWDSTSKEILTLTGITGLVTGSLIPDTDNAYDLGAPGSSFRAIYVATSTIYIGTGKLSADEGGNIFVTNSNQVSSFINSGGGGGSSTKITVATVVDSILNGSSNPAITTGTYGTYYTIRNSAFNTITLPNSAEADAGSFWVFRNNTGAYLNITVTYTGSQSGESTGIITIPPQNSLTIVFTVAGSGESSYAFF